MSNVSTNKAIKFKSLLRSPSGNQERKEEIILPNEIAKSPAHELVLISGKKKATFVLDAELHRRLKVHALTINKDMVQILEEVLGSIVRHKEEIALIITPVYLYICTYRCTGYC